MEYVPLFHVLYQVMEYIQVLNSALYTECCKILEKQSSSKIIDDLEFHEWVSK